MKKSASAVNTLADFFALVLLWLAVATNITTTKNNYKEIQQGFSMPIRNRCMPMQKGRQARIKKDWNPFSRISVQFVASIYCRHSLNVDQAGFNVFNNSGLFRQTQSVAQE